MATPGQFIRDGVKKKICLAYSFVILMLGKMKYILQWNLSDPDTNGTEENVLISEVS